MVLKCLHNVKLNAAVGKALKLENSKTLLLWVVSGDLNVLLKALLAKNEGKSGVGSRVISKAWCAECRSQY